MTKSKGWTKESTRHSLASRGVKTGRKEGPRTDVSTKYDSLEYRETSLILRYFLSILVQKIPI